MAEEKLSIEIKNNPFWLLKEDEKDMEKLTQRKEMNEPSDGLSAAYDFIEGSILEIDQQQRKFVDCTCTCTSASFD